MKLRGTLMWERKCTQSTRPWMSLLQGLDVAASLKQAAFLLFCAKDRKSEGFSFENIWLLGHNFEKKQQPNNNNTKRFSDLDRPPDISSS